MINPLISIILPVLNEETIIDKTLKQFSTNSNVEIIVVDGGSQDKTPEIVKQRILENKQIKLITNTRSGRSNQMNCGAKSAMGNILLFLHADSTLPKAYSQIIPEILSQKQIIIGAFKLKIDNPKKSLRLIEKMVNWRSHRLSLPYGDQGFFMTKNNFNRLGGFADLPIMEDFELIQRSKSQGKIAISNYAVITSARRWQKLGVLKTTVINQLIIIGYCLKISPHYLRNLYHYFQ